MAVEIPSTLSDHPQLVGIVRFPNCTVTTQEVGVPTITKNSEGKYQSIRQGVDMAVTINGSSVESDVITVPKATTTDFYPYTYYVLTDGECDPLILYPQYLPNTFTIKGKFALSHQPIERYYPSSYKGDTSGNIYNITNTSQMMLPTSTNEGVAYMNANANSIAESRRGIVKSNILSGITATFGAIKPTNPFAVTTGIDNIISGFQQIKEMDARNKDIQTTPNSISSFGTPSTRQAFNTSSVRLIRYTISDIQKQKINNFISRYGNKFNNYAVINHKEYKGYLKMISPKISSKLDTTIVEKITSILERGVYIE